LQATSLSKQIATDESKLEPDSASTFYDNTNNLFLMDSDSSNLKAVDNDYEIFEDNEDEEDVDNYFSEQSHEKQKSQNRIRSSNAEEDNEKINIDISISRSSYANANVAIQTTSPTDKISSTPKPQYQQNQARNTRKLSKLDRKGRYMTDPLAKQHVNEHANKLPKRNSLNDKFQTHDENQLLVKQVHGDSTSTIMSTDSGVSSTTYGNQSNSLESIIKLTDMKLSEEEADDIFKNFVNSSALNKKEKLVLKFDARKSLNPSNGSDGNIQRIDEDRIETSIFNDKSRFQNKMSDDDDDRCHLVIHRNDTADSMFDFNNNSTEVNNSFKPKSYCDHDFPSRFYTNNDGKPLVVNLENRTLKIRNAHKQPLQHDRFYSNYIGESGADKEIEILTTKTQTNNHHQHNRRHIEKRSATPVDYMVSPADMSSAYDQSIRSASAKSMRQDNHQRFMLVSLLHTTQDAT
jgi:hypothetical protein